MNTANPAFELDDDNVLLIDSGDGGDGDDEGDLPGLTPATDAEIKAWYQYDWAAGVVHMQWVLFTSARILLHLQFQPSCVCQQLCPSLPYTLSSVDARPPQRNWC